MAGCDGNGYPTSSKLVNLDIYDVEFLNEAISLFLDFNMFWNDFIISKDLSSLFWGCVNIQSIVLPKTTTSIGGDAFHGCSSLTSIVIPKGVTSIGNYMFDGLIKEL